jgi:hypothetical protein
MVLPIRDFQVLLRSLNRNFRPSMGHGSSSMAISFAIVVPVFWKMGTLVNFVGVSGSCLDRKVGSRPGDRPGKESCLGHEVISTA